MAAARSGSGAGPTAGEKASAPGRKSRPMLVPADRPSRSWISRFGSALARRAVELDQHLVRHGEPEVSGDLARQELGDQRLPAVPRPENLTT